MDAPAHVRKDGITLDKLPADKFVGKALVIDCSDLSEGDKIDISYINKYKDIIYLQIKQKTRKITFL